MRGSIGMRFNPTQTAKEKSIEDSLNRKKLVPDIRNGFELRRNGDKAYR